MLTLSRAARRVLVMGAVVALGTMLIAPMASGSESSSSSLDPPGVDVPGWEAAKVSGEATGCHSEIEINFDPTVLPDTDGAAAADFQAASEGIDEVLDKLAAGPALPGDPGAQATEVLQQAQKYLNEATTSEDDPDPTEIFHEEAGPVPTVELPWQGGGPVTEEEDDCTLTLFGVLPIPLASDLKVETEGAIGPAGYSHTEAESSDNFGLFYVADKVDTECLATLEDIEAKTTVEDGQYLDINSLTINDIPEHPKKNQELTGFEIEIPAGPINVHFEFSLNANEQDDEDSSVTVTGLHSELVLDITFNGQTFLKVSIDGIRDQSHCDLHSVATGAAEPLVIEPKFTG